MYTINKIKNLFSFFLIFRRKHGDHAMEKNVINDFIYD